MRGMSVLVALMATILAISVLRLDAAVDKPILPTVTDDEGAWRLCNPCLIFTVSEWAQQR